MYSESLCPQIAFFYGSGPAASNKLFRSWCDLIPFSSSIPIDTRLSIDQKKALVSQAERVCNHQFDLLGSGSYNFLSDIDWHFDFKSSYRWPSHTLHFKTRSQTKAGADIKVPWELSRFHHSLVLALSWQCTGSKKYSKELFYQISDWIDKNPNGFGVNWTCPMEVAIRAVNWVISFALLLEPLLEDHQKHFRNKITHSLWQHAHFLRTHLEWNGPQANSGANHLLFDLTGLLTLGCFFKDSRKGQVWLRFAKNQIEYQMERQVFSDGVHFECSIGYHRLCLEAFLWCAALAKKLGDPFSWGFYKKLSKMHKFVSDYIKPSGVAPLIGDNDDGRLIDTGVFFLHDHSYLLPKSSKGIFCLDRFLLDGTTSLEEQGSSLVSSSYKKSGFFFFRNSKARLLTRAGVLAYDGTHAHNDQLSFELSVNNIDVFIDRGTYQYSANPYQRNLFRSTSAHNTMQVNNIEQNRFLSDVFSMKRETNTKVIENTDCHLKAKLNGFNKLTTREFQHERVFHLNENELIICDAIRGVENGDVLHWYFHVAPSLRSEFSGQSVIQYLNKKRICILKPEFTVQAELGSFQHSPSYGIVMPAQRIHYKYEIDENSYPSTFSFIISWE